MNKIDIGLVKSKVNTLTNNKKVTVLTRDQRLWQAAIDDPESVATYIVNNGPRTFPDGVFRYLPSAWKTKFGTTVPAVIARLIDPIIGEQVGVHLIPLDQTGTARNSMIGPKTIQRRSGGLIQLAKPGDVLAICVGIEAGLAFFEHRRIPTWIATAPKDLEGFIPPPNVKQVIRVEGDSCSGLLTKWSGQHFITRPHVTADEIARRKPERFSMSSIRIKPSKEDGPRQPVEIRPVSLPLQTEVRS